MIDAKLNIDCETLRRLIFVAQKLDPDQRRELIIYARKLRSGANSKGLKRAVVLPADLRGRELQ